jgi:hypothetical protein
MKDLPLAKEFSRQLSFEFGNGQGNSSQKRLVVASHATLPNIDYAESTKATLRSY